MFATQAVNGRLVLRVGLLEAVDITHQLAFDEIVFRTKRSTTANLCVG